MAGTIDMKHMMYLNLFSKITNVVTSHCFVYNETIFFCVPSSLVSKSIGEEGRNTKKLNQILNRKIKVVAIPKGIENVRSFIENIVDPVIFKNVEIRDNVVILTASTQSKAALIGRNKRRLLEMQQIIKDFFAKEFRIV